MKKTNAIKAVSALAGASVLLAGCAPAAAPEAAQPAVPAEAVSSIDVNGGVLELSEAVSYDKLAAVNGTFSFTQDVMSPASDIFNLFGTAATAMCAKPAFALENTAEDGDYLVNIGGKIKKQQSISLSKLKEQGTTRTMVCSCATSPSLAQTSVTGARVADLLTLAGVDDDANAITFKAADGHATTMPLSYVLDKDALLVYDIAGEGNPSGVQVWMPATVAKYFTRQVTEIELTREDVLPEVDAAEPAQRAKISILNHSEETFSAGDTITFEGYADDCGVAISAIEFSLDGENWTACPVENASADKWVKWSFDYEAAQPGTFKLDVRARTADGAVSPLASSVVFTVE